MLAWYITKTMIRMSPIVTFDKDHPIWIKPGSGPAVLKQICPVLNFPYKKHCDCAHLIWKGNHPDWIKLRTLVKMFSGRSELQRHEHMWTLIKGVD